ncbi:hypothetical protein BJ912DRAFT_948006 [Pholiota molesta]|nr:hypothetical protein BJ912DRAFT_948006 [Pholiota molesta]
MYFPRFITLFVSLACATSSLAGPIASDADAVVARAPAPTDEVLERQLPVASLLSVLTDLSTVATPLLGILQGSVANPGAIDTAGLTSSLQGIITALTAAQSELQTIALNPTSIVSDPASITALVGVAGPFLQLLLSGLSVASGVVSTTPLGPQVTPLITTIGTMLTTVLTLSSGLGTGLMISMLPILLSLVAPLTSLGLTSILGLAGI